MSPLSARRHRLARPHLALLSLILLSVIFWLFRQLRSSSSHISNGKCLVSHGAYKGSIYAKPSETLGNACLVESPWMRLAQHSVRLPNGGKVVDDWLWIDYHDRINVLVEAPPAKSDGTKNDAAEEKSFLILSQTKYALPSTSLAIVGGIIEPHEEAERGARREVEEELSVQCKEWIGLGRYRTDVNRGMGWVHPYLARDCSYTSSAANVDANADEVGGRDAEKQHVRTMTMSEVKNAAMEGKFVEVQWSNSVALAMLHYATLDD